jgi:hypothetical protein
MWKRLFDENTWHGKAIKMIVSAPKVAIVLVFFTGLFAVITVDSVVRRMRQAPKAKRTSLI